MGIKRMRGTRMPLRRATKHNGQLCSTTQNEEATTSATRNNAARPAGRQPPIPRHVGQQQEKL